MDRNGRRPRPDTRLRRFRRRLTRAFLPLLQASLGGLPWRIVLAAGAALGWLAYLVQPRRRRRARENLARSFEGELGPRQIRSLVRRVFTGLGMNLAETCWVAARPSRGERLVEIDGWEHLQAARALGKGLVLITGHVGSWDLMASVVARRGIPVSVIARESRDGRVNEFMVSLRSRLGVRSILRGSTGAARAILRTLRSGEALASIIDQDTRVQGIFVEFFGRPAFTPTGPISLALRSGAPVVLMAGRRLPGGRHRLRFDPPIRLSQDADREEEIRRHTAAFTRWLEERIREHPEQWVWIHRRWRRSERSAPRATREPSD